MLEKTATPKRYLTAEDSEKLTPVHVVWEITLACDLKCQHCGSRAGHVRNRELSTEECVDLVRQFAQLGTREMTLIGGEAYLRKDWLKIINEISSNGILCTMQSGALNLTDERLRQAADAREIPLIVNATVSALFVDAGRVIRGVEITRPDGTRDALGCQALTLACNGYGGAPDLVAKYIPEMRHASYFGHPGNCGDAVLWGGELGAKLDHMSGYQGHGSVAHPHGILISWAVVMEGGFQVNQNGERFSDESLGYSEQAAVVLAQPQPGCIAFDIFDERIAAIARQFADFRQAEELGAIIEAPTLAFLAERLNVPPPALAQSLAEIEEARHTGCPDRFGRRFAGEASLAPPFKAVKVTGALFHTQGGLAVDGTARVLDASGKPLPNLFAAGGAAAGVSGPSASGYLSGNGLLTATVLGRIAGQAAAASLQRTAPASGQGIAL